MKIQYPSVSFLSMAVLSLLILTHPSIGSPAVSFPSLDVRASIPPPPADPPLGPDENPKAWNSEPPTWWDRQKYRIIKAVASEVKNAWPNAARHLNHYLDDTGTDLNIVPEHMMYDMPEFTESVMEIAWEQVQKAYRKASTGSGKTVTFASPWKSWSDEEWEMLIGLLKSDKAAYNRYSDWFLALGGFSYSVAGTLTTQKFMGSYRVSIQYVMYIFDRYNWDNGKRARMGVLPILVSDDTMGRLHTVGLAKEFTCRGKSKVQNILLWTPTQPLPKPSGIGPYVVW